MTMYVAHEQLFLRVSYNNNSYHAPVNVATGGSVGHVRTTQIHRNASPWIVRRMKYSCPSNITCHILQYSYKYSYHDSHNTFDGVSPQQPLYSLDGEWPRTQYPIVNIMDAMRFHKSNHDILTSHIPPYDTIVVLTCISPYLGLEA